MDAPVNVRAASDERVEELRTANSDHDSGSLHMACADEALELISRIDQVKAERDGYERHVADKIAEIQELRAELKQAKEHLTLETIHAAHTLTELRHERDEARRQLEEAKAETQGAAETLANYMVSTGSSLISQNDALKREVAGLRELDIASGDTIRDLQRQLDEARNALRRVSVGMARILSGRPVRDADEMLTEADRLLVPPQAGDESGEELREQSKGASSRAASASLSGEDDAKIALAGRGEMHVAERPPGALAGFKAQGIHQAQASEPPGYEQDMSKLKTWFRAEQDAGNVRTPEEIDANRAACRKPAPQPASVTPTREPRLFTMIRESDESGVSGTGRVLDGVHFHTGQVVVCWRTDIEAAQHGYSSLGTYPSWDAFAFLHIKSHPTNRTRVEWLARLENGGGEEK